MKLASDKIALETICFEARALKNFCICFWSASCHLHPTFASLLGSNHKAGKAFLASHSASSTQEKAVSLKINKNRGLIRLSKFIKTTAWQSLPSSQHYYG